DLDERDARIARLCPAVDRAPRDDVRQVAQDVDRLGAGADRELDRPSLDRVGLGEGVPQTAGPGPSEVAAAVRGVGGVVDPDAVDAALCETRAGEAEGAEEDEGEGEDPYASSHDPSPAVPQGVAAVARILSKITPTRPGTAGGRGVRRRTTSDAAAKRE